MASYTIRTASADANVFAVATTVAAGCCCVGRLAALIRRRNQRRQRSKGSVCGSKKGRCMENTKIYGLSYRESWSWFWIAQLYWRSTNCTTGFDLLHQIVRLWLATIDSVKSGKLVARLTIYDQFQDGHVYMCDRNVRSYTYTFRKNRAILQSYIRSSLIGA